ncbi:MAG TPA: permease [Ignavibacteriaceae bacterium]|nr:permease [Ignavibacteriaceae bacterium]
MDWKEQYKSFLWILGFFLFAYFMPIESESFKGAILAAFDLAKWYAKEHVLLCLIPAFFIAGTIAVFISQAAVVKYFGARAKKWVAYLVAAGSGTILAVCSCTVLPLFSSIHKRGAGLGPAMAFLYSGPAINILAIILTARILGLELGIARVIGAVSFSIIIGLIMAFIYRKEEKERAEAQLAMPEVEEPRPIWQTALHFFILVAILVFVNWGKPADKTEGFWYFMFANKWFITGLFGIGFALSMIYIIQAKKLYVILGTIAVIISAIIFYHNPTITFVVAVVATTLALTFTEGEPNQWLGETWGFTKQIMPLLAAGVLVAGFLLGLQNNNNGVIPNEWISALVGGNSLFSNFFASITGAFMYFATLTEIPILQGLINSGMGKGPALALLLAGPALSLPNMLVIRGVIGTQKTVVYVSLVVVMATISGLIYGALF